MCSANIRNDMTDAPDWVDGKRIDEVRFCGAFLEKHPMVSKRYQICWKCCEWSAVRKGCPCIRIGFTNKVYIGGGRFARGFLGLALIQRPPL